MSEDYRTLKDELRETPLTRMIEENLKKWCADNNYLYVVRGAAGRDELDYQYKLALEEQKIAEREKQTEENRRRIEERKAEYYAEFCKKIPPRYRNASIADLAMKESATKILKGASALILGNNGAGKNHFIWALAREWARNGETVKVEKAQELLYRIKCQDDPYSYIRREYRESVMHLIVDEMDKIFESRADFVYLNYLYDQRYEWMLQSIGVGNGDKDGFIAALGQSIYSRLTGEGGVYLQHKGEDRRKTAI